MKKCFKKEKQNTIKPNYYQTKTKNQNQCTMFYMGPKDTGFYTQLSSLLILSKGQLKEMQNEPRERGSFSLMNGREKAGQQLNKINFFEAKVKSRKSVVRLQATCTSH